MEIVDIVKETKRGSVEISMLNIMECLVYLPEQDADQIIVLDDGKSAGVGTSEELLKTNEIYREVYESQVKGGGDDE